MPIDLTVIANPSDSSAEVEAPALTGDLLLDTYNALMVQRLQVIRLGPKMRYSLHGHSLDWSAYLIDLDARILNVRVQMSQDRPFDSIGVCF